MYDDSLCILLEVGEKLVFDQIELCWLTNQHPNQFARTGEYSPRRMSSLLSGGWVAITVGNNVGRRGACGLGSLMLYPLRHRLAGAAIPLRRNLAPQLTGIRAASLPALQQIAEVRIELTAPSWLARSFRKGRGVCEVAGGSPTQANAFGNLLNGDALGVQRTYVFIASITASPMRLLYQMSTCRLRAERMRLRGLLLR